MRVPRNEGMDIFERVAKIDPRDSENFLKEFRKKYGFLDIKKILGDLRDIRVLLIGDAILDEYVYCTQMDRVGKEPLIAYRELGSEMHVGGVFAVANHLAEFVDDVEMVTCVGNNKLNFAKRRVNRRVKQNIFSQPGSKTLIKKRYIDAYRRNKEFEVYNVPGLEINSETEAKIIEHLEKKLNERDLVIVTDFGHGFVSENIKKILGRSRKYLAVNAQLNGGNLGYNFITNYNRADFVSLNDRETRLPLQEKSSDIRISIRKLARILGLKSANVTLGKYGGTYYRNGDFYHVPSFTKNPLDTIGAGDAVLSLTSLLSYKNADPQITAFLGNCVGAVAVGIVGNREPVTQESLENLVKNLIK